MQSFRLLIVPPLLATGFEALHEEASGCNCCYWQRWKIKGPPVKLVLVLVLVVVVVVLLLLVVVLVLVLLQRRCLRGRLRDSWLACGVPAPRKPGEPEELGSRRFEWSDN